MAKEKAAVVEFKVYRYVAQPGSESLLGPVRLNLFGQRFRIETATATMAQKGGIAIIEDEQFTALGFTEEELKIWASPFMSDHDVPADEKDAVAKAAFLEKKRKAQEAFIGIRQGLLDDIDKHREDAPGPARDEPVATPLPVSEPIPAPAPVKAAPVSKKTETANG